MFAYCNNNPVIHQDSAGAAVETVFDFISLGMSIVEVAANPRDPWAQVGLAGDLIDVAVPFVGGIGEATRALKVASNASEAVSDVRKGWKVGDDITNLTKAGKKPSWTTVRQRYWKNEAHFNPQNYTDDNLKLMKQGRAPLVQYNGKLYPMELHHKIPRHKGGSDAFENLLPLTPWEHAIIDDFRHFKP